MTCKHMPEVRNAPGHALYCQGALRTLCPRCGIRIARDDQMRQLDHALYALPNAPTCPGPMLDWEDMNGLTCPHGAEPLRCAACWDPPAPEDRKVP